MGLIKAAIGAAGGVLGDQWKEFFYCDSLNETILMAKGQKRISRFGRSSPAARLRDSDDIGCTRHAHEKRGATPGERIGKRRGD